MLWSPIQMPKSLTNLWLRGLRRLITGQAETVRSPKTRTPAKQKRATTVKKAKVAAPVKSAPAPRASARPPVHESRVRPRASAWARGKWERSFHSAPPTAGRFVNHLSYALYTPPGAALARMPLVVMLHGCKQNADEFAQGTRINLLADRYGFAVLYPEQSKHDHAHRCWRWYDDSSAGGGGEAASVVSLVQAVVAQHRLDPERVYVAGRGACRIARDPLSVGIRCGRTAFGRRVRRGALRGRRDGRHAARQPQRPGWADRRHRRRAQLSGHAGHHRARRTRFGRVG
jgi:hypothetical protein